MCKRPHHSTGTYTHREELLGSYVHTAPLPHSQVPMYIHTHTHTQGRLLGTDVHAPHHSQVHRVTGKDHWGPVCIHPLPTNDRYTQSQEKIPGDLCAHTPTTHRYTQGEVTGVLRADPPTLISTCSAVTQEKMHTRRQSLFFNVCPSEVMGLFCPKE